MDTIFNCYYGTLFNTMFMEGVAMVTVVDAGGRRSRLQAELWQGGGPGKRRMQGVPPLYVIYSK